MGRMYAEGIAGTTLTLEQQLDWHLRGNHMPPIPASMIPVCRDVIIHLNGGGDVNQHFKLPKQTTWQGKGSAPAWAIAEGHHLESWITYDDE